MKVCRNFYTYKGLKAPRCNNGDPCEGCQRRFTLTQAETKFQRARGAADVKKYKAELTKAQYAFEKYLREIKNYGKNSKSD